jgi:hypothetical protein
VHHGVDVSSNNHPDNASIDWPLVFADLKARGGGQQPFAIVKAIQGTHYVNPFFSEDVNGARAAGFALGAYLMDQGDDDPAAREAVFRRVAGPLPQFDDDELPEGNLAYATHCAALVAQNPAALVYLNQSQEDEGFPTGAALWEANYNDLPGVTHKPALIHQYTNIGSVDGIIGAVDVDAFLGTEAEFAALFAAVTTTGDDEVTSQDIQNIVEAFQSQFQPGHELFDRVVQACIQALREQPVQVAQSPGG